MRLLLAAVICYFVATRSYQLDLVERTPLATITANCRRALGLANGRIQDYQITALSAYNNDFETFGPQRARLNLTSWPPGHRAAPGQAASSWIKIELRKKMVITGIATQGYGDPSVEEWTQQYMVMYSNDGDDYSYFKDPKGVLKLFTANKDGSSIQLNEVPLPTVVSSIMIMPVLYHNNFAVRMELFGCEPGYYFMVWLMLGEFNFKTNFLDKENVEFKIMEDDVMYEITYTLEQVAGFLSAKMMRFSPQTSATSGFETKLTAEVRIDCIEVSVHDISAALTNYIEIREGLFDKSYIKLQYSLDYRCRPPEVYVHLNKSVTSTTKITTVDMFVIRGEVVTKCNTSASVTRSWESNEVEDKSFSIRQVLALDTDNVTINPKQLNPGLYYIRLVAEMNKEEGAIAYDYGFLEVVLPDLVVKISGVSQALKGTGAIVLDGTDSYDPQEPTMKDQGMEFTWLCRREDEDFSTLETEPIDTPSGREKIFGGCYGFGVGPLNTTEPMVTIDVNKMTSMHSYVFKLIARKGNRSSSAYHVLKVDSSISFTIRCKINCGSKVTANKRMVIESSCVGLSCQTVARYNWTLYELDQWSENVTWFTVPDLDQKIMTDLDSPSLVFVGKINEWENALLDDATYRLIASVYLNDDTVEESEIRFNTNSAPYPETFDAGCFVTPEEGFAVTTEYLIQCEGWYDEDLPLSYEFSYHTNTGTVTFQTGYSKNATTRLPLGNPLHDYVIALEIQIIDALGAAGLEILVVKVEAMATKDVSGTLMNMASGTKSPLGNLLTSGDVDKAANMAYAVLSMVDKSEGKMDGKDKKEVNVVRNVLRSKFNVSKSDVRNLKDTIINQMAGVKVTSLQQVTQMAAVVALATEQKDEISQSSQENAVNMLENTADFVTSQLTSGSPDPGLVQSVGASLLHGISNVISAASSNAQQEDEEDGEPGSGEDKEGQEKSKVDKGKSKKMAEKTLKLMDKVGSSLLATKAVGEKPSVFKTKSMALTLDRQVPSKIGGKTLGEGEGSGGVALPGATSLFGDKAGSLPSVDSQMMAFKDNPYTWDSSSKGIKSSVIDFSLKSEDGTSIEVSGLAEPVELFIPQKEDNKQKGGNNTLEQYFAKPSHGSKNMRYHQIVVPSDSVSVTVEIKPEEGKSVEVYVSYETRPTVDKHAFAIVLPDYSYCSVINDTGGFNCSSNPYKFGISSAITGHTGPHYVGVRFPHRENDPPPSEPEVEIAASRQTRACESYGGRQKRSCVGVKDPPTTPPPAPKILIPKYNASTDANYTMSVTVTSCLYWSEKKQIWTDDGCKVGPKTVAGNLHCLCTHLSAFGGDFFVAPNPIDFDKVWAEFGNLAESGNFVVLSVVCSIFGLYFVGLVFARKADKKDQMKVIANVYLTDNVDQGYVYEISVQTGMWKGYGTTANIGVIIYGEQGSTPPIPLSDPDLHKIFFARGSINNFTLSVPESLGDLVKIKIWHDNSGSNPAWFFQQVQIVDAQTGEKWHFLGNRWLAVEKGSGQVEAEIKVADKKELAGFRNLFYSRTARSLGDGHLWLSVFTRPPHNPFTRCQRLTCCLSIMFATLVTNAMFYQFKSPPADTFQVGPLKMSWTQIKIGIQSSIIAIPVNVLVVMIFKNIKQPLPEDVRGNADAPKKKAPGCLPHFFVYFGWILCILCSLAAAMFTVFYSLMWGAETSNQWLTSIMVSFFQDVVLTQPIKVVLIASLLSLIIKKPPEQDEVLGSSLSRSGGKDGQLAPPAGEELKKAREFRKKVLEMFRTIIEMSFFFLFIGLLMVVCYGNRKSTRYTLTSALEKLFNGFDKVHTPATFWSWTQKILVPGLYNVQWYNGDQFEYEEGFISNREAFMVGMPRLRQARLRPDAGCLADGQQPLLTIPFTRCLSLYTEKVEDTTPYSQPGWIPLYNTSALHSIFELYDMCPKPWRYRAAEALNIRSTQGVHTTYSGGGYVADLGYNARDAREVLDNLEKNGWINDLTAAVFVEFTIYQPATSLFSAVKYLYEQIPTGGSSTKTKVLTLTLYSSPDPTFKSFFQLCQLILMLVILFFFFAEIGKIYRQKCQYFTRFWNWAELVQIFCAVAALVMFFFKEKYTSDFVSRVQENPFETSSTDYIVLWSDLEIYLLSFVIFVVTLKFLRLIRFNRHICQMTATIQKSVDHVLSFFFVFLGIILAFTQLGLLVFGSVVPAYSSFTNAMRAVLQMILGGETHFHELVSTSRIVGPLFVFCYMFMMSMVMLNMFLAILNDSYEEVKEVQGDSFADAELGEFMSKYFRTRVGYLTGELTGFFKKMLGMRKAKARPKIDEIDSYVKVPMEEFGDYDKQDKDENVKVNIATMDSMEDLGLSEEDISSLDDIKRSLSLIGSELRQSISCLDVDAGTEHDTNLNDLNKHVTCSCEEVDLDLMNASNFSYNRYPYWTNIWEKQRDSRGFEIGNYRRKRARVSDDPARDSLLQNEEDLEDEHYKSAEIWVPMTPDMMSDTSATTITLLDDVHESFV